MDRFSQAFSAARASLNTALAGDTEKLRSDLKSLVAPGGPDPAQKEVLTKLRTALAGATPGQEAAAIVTASGPGNKPGERAATLKMLRHFYHGQTAGAAAIWVYSPPKEYTKWIHDEVPADGVPQITSALSKNLTEVYSREDQAVMVQAIGVAHDIAINAALKIEGKSAETNALLKQYFSDETTTPEALTEAGKTLAKGYKKIAAGLASSSLVISDEPIDRNGGGWKDWAFIYPSEAMKVIYLQGAWVSKANEVTPSNMSPLYRCARTIIHEMSHKECNTDDVVYGPKGLKPEGSANLTGAYALMNADSWAYFAVDVCDFLTGPDATNATTKCRGIIGPPTSMLSV